MVEPEYRNWIDGVLSGAETVDEATKRLKLLFHRAGDERLNDLTDEILSSLQRDAINIVAGYFEDLSRSTNNTAYVDYLPWQVRRGVTRSAGTLGVVMESTPIRNAVELTDTALSLARVVMLCVERYNQSPDDEGLYDIVRNWLTLRGYVWSAVMPTRSQPWLEWTTGAGGVAEPIKEALLAGNRVYEDNRERLRAEKFSALEVLPWESEFQTDELIDWLGLAYATAIANDNTRRSMQTI